MSSDSSDKRKLPSDIEQILIVAKYELLKYLRSRRLFGFLIAISILLALFYILPPALGSPYSGSRTVDLEVHANQTLLSFFPGYHSHAEFSPPDMIEETLIITVNGSALQSDQWLLHDLLPMILFTSNLSDSNVVATYDHKMGSTSFASNFLSFLEFLIILCAVLFAADALVSEFQNRTAYLLFPNPVRKEVLFLGKFLASFIASIVIIALFYVVIIALSYATLGGVANYIEVSFGFAILFLLAVIAIAYLISSILKGSIGAIVLTLLLLILILPMVTESVGSIAGVKMSPVVTFAGHSVTYSLYIDDYPEDTIMEIEGAGFTIYIYYPDLALSTIVLILYVLILMPISMSIFKRKQLTG